MAPDLAETGAMRAASTPGGAFWCERAALDDDDEDEEKDEEDDVCECECVFVCVGTENAVMGTSGCATAAAPVDWRARVPRLLPDDDEDVDDAAAADDDDDDDNDDDDGDDDATAVAA